ncbi:MAG TPA: LysE family translocator [Candidatus Saccharimonadales bacterium]|nr:LysE family translocator [Candidatus Saccharimonadales bacterium]
MDARFAAFVVASALLIMLPGPDMALVTRNALRAGGAGASFTALGAGVGILGWATASTVGVGVLLERSVTAFTLLKLAGAIYLGYLGLRSLVGSQRSGSMTEEARPPAMRRADAVTFFRQGVLGNLLNPKAGVIFVTIIPQFVRPGDPFARLLLMLLAFEVMMVIWLNFYGFVISRLGRGALGGRLRHAVERVTGAILIGLGVKLVFEQATR